MRINKHALKITTFTTVFALSIALVVVKNQSYKDVNAYNRETTLPSTIDLNDCTAQQIRSYYSSLNSLSTSERQGTNLLKNLKTILSNNQKYYAYDGSTPGAMIWQMYEITDRDWNKSPASSMTNGTYNSSTHIVTNYVYGSNSDNKENPYIHALYINRNIDNETRAWGNHEQDGWGINREHIWAKAHGFQASGNGGARGDPMHLWAGNGYANNIHSDYCFGFVNKNQSYVDCGTKYGTAYGNLRGKSLNASGSYTVFEPQDCDKGDIARAIFYMVARYNNYANATSGFDSNNPNLKLTNNLGECDTSGTSTASTAYGMGLLSDLLAWNKLDPVDEYEIHRNNILYKNYTNNRNPFIDFPEWADAIWGTVDLDGKNYNSTVSTYATPSSDAIVTPVVSNTFSISSNMLNLTVGGTAQISANNANGNITWTVGNSAIVSLNKTSTSNNENITITALSNGTTTITATSGSNSASCQVTVSNDTINYGSEDNPLTVAEAKELIDAFNGEQTPKPLYVKGIVSSSTYSSQYGNYEIWLQNENDTNAREFELFRAKIDTTKVGGDYTADNAFAGKEVTAYGYAKKYNSTYELCTSSDEPKSPLVVFVVTPTTVSLSQTSIDIKPGQSTTLTATITPSDPHVSYVWSSSDESVATVNNGVVKGLSLGTAVITATVDEDLEASCTVTVSRIGSAQATDTLFTADLISDMSVDDGYTISAGNYAKKTGYYQDGSTADTQVYFKVLSDSPLFNSEPTTISFSATLGAGAAKDPLDNNVEACLVDENGDEITSTKRTLTTSITTTATDYSVELPYNANAYGAKISHVKVSGHNIRYYSFSLSYASSSANPAEYLAYSSFVAVVTADETVASNESIVDSLVFADAGLSNMTQLEGFPFGDIWFTADKSDGNTVPKYMLKDKSFWLYAGNVLLLDSDYTNITKIEMTFVTGSYADFTLDSDLGTLGENGWIGNDNYVCFKCLNDVRISRVDVTHSDIVSVSNIAYRVGCTIPKANWDALAEDHTISNYGVMFVTYDTLQSYPESTVADAYRNGRALAKVYANTSNAPLQVGNNYMFTARINITDTNNCQTTYCSAPFVVVDDEYYFLPQFNNTVSNVVARGNNDLSPAAIQIIASYGL